ncbi:hypothetical protein ASG84_24830 [Rhodococcus sp. Leaf278]|uniref:hypothetical protein n=1 Tax=Rhodococcus sp. Leaf278 TaxID=1736319 RepID=UPI00070FCF04|nr:hypothetical protein [Rhodococcus sp. Leaf278]KQU52386.1 hypothetical protein ASG84_24830 [Rhodococcus sp. Leaf278]
MTEDSSSAHARADNASSKVFQGDVLPLQEANVRVVDSTYPLTDAAVEVAEAEGKELILAITDAEEHVVVLSQTCDLRRSSDRLPNFQVAPVLAVDEKLYGEIYRGHRPGYASLPWFQPFHVADLSKITTLERSLLVDVEVAGTIQSDLDRAIFAEAIARHFARVALPDAFTPLLYPLLDRMKKKAGKQSNEGSCLGRIASIRLEGTPNFSSASPRLTVIFVLESGDFPDYEGVDELDMNLVDTLVESKAVDRAAAMALDTENVKLCHEGWLACAALWTQESVLLAAAADDVDSLDYEVVSGRQFSFERSRNAPEVDLTYLTTRGD